jgi:hypothetical protein
MLRRGLSRWKTYKLPPAEESFGATLKKVGYRNYFHLDFLNVWIRSWNRISILNDLKRRTRVRNESVPMYNTAK